MRKVKIVTPGLSILLWFSLPAAADASGGLFLGFGAGLLTGYNEDSLDMEGHEHALF